MTINKRQTSIMYFLLSISFMTFISINTFTKISKSNNLIIIIIGGILSHFFLNFYISLIKNKNKNNNNIFKIINIILTSIIIIFSTSKMTLFINYNLLKNVNLYVISATFLILIYYINHKGKKVIFKTAELFSYIFILIFFLNLISLFKYIDFKNIIILENINYIEIVKGVSVYILVTTSPIYLLSEIDNIEYNEKYLKKYNLYSFIFIIINILLTLSILGINLTNIYINPEVTILKKISFLNIIDRMENLFSINFFISGFFFIAIAFYVLTKNINSLLKIKKEELSNFIIILLIYILINSINLNIDYYLIILLIMPIILIGTKSLHHQ